MAACIFTAFFHTDSAFADRSVTISGSSIFYTADEAEVWAHKEDGADGEDPEYFSMFVLKNGKSAVNYRKNLAYSWKYNTSSEEVKEGVVSTLTPVDGWFNMEIGFESVSFKKFIITFESQQYVKTKDGKSANYVMFYPKDSGVQVVISANKEDAPEESATVFGKDHIKIEFTSSTRDGYNVKVSQGENTPVEGVFENVGGTFSKYSSSTSSPVTPLSFKAEFTEGENAEADWARLVIYKLNGQSFRIGTYKKIERNEDGSLKLDNLTDNYKKIYKLEGREYVRNDNPTPEPDKNYFTYTPGVREEEGHYKGGTINDNAPPVICFNSGVSFVGLGKELPFNYQLIDVLASSPSADTFYYMLTNEQAADANFKADNFADKNLFRQVTDSDNQFMEPHKDHYIPVKEDIAVYDEANFKVSAAVKVYLKLYDTRTENISQTTYVLLDWFVPANNLVTKNGNKYIAVANDEEGVTFAYTDESDPTAPKSDVDSQDWKDLKAAYQALVDEAAKDLKAGSKNYFYLPSFDKIAYGTNGEKTGSLFADKIDEYKDLSFNVYYNNGSNGNTTTQKSNALAINLTKAGRYVFTIYATDSSSNPMYYYKADGEKKTFTSSNIWSMRESKKGTEYENTKDYLPWFSFNVEASEITIEDPGEREAAFVDSKYSGISFDVNAVSFERKYELYRFDNDVYYNDPKGGNGKALTYDEFMERKEELIETHPEWFTEIPAASTLTEGSDEYEEFYKYGWNSSSPEFTPQDANTFYVVKLTVSSTVDNLEPKTAYMGISASAKVRSFKGEDTWLQDNMTSIILLAIAGASLIGIILLLVIKPKNKGDIDEQYEETKKKKKK